MANGQVRGREERLVSESVMASNSRPGVDRPAAAPIDVISPRLRRARDAMIARCVELPCAVVLRDAAGGAEVIGPGEPVLEATIRTAAGERALRSLSELAIAEAYMNGDIDLDGDLVRALELRVALRDDRLAARAWSIVEPVIQGRRRHNPKAIERHYDLANVQLLAIDERFHVYTPGIYDTDDEALEPAAERKLQTAYEALALAPGRSLLDIGCGWGGFLRYSAARGVDATGITLSRDQRAYAQEALRRDGVRAKVLYEDFFSYRPTDTFDAISLMGVVEDLSDYPAVMHRLAGWLAPGGRVYLDFAAVAQRFQVSSFVAKHVWPGGFRMVHMPQFVAASDGSPLEIVAIDNDRRNYHLWACKLDARLCERHDAVRDAADERTFRLLRLLAASTSFVMGPRSARATAYRVLMRRRSAGSRLGELVPAARTAARDSDVARAAGLIRRLR